MTLNKVDSIWISDSPETDCPTCKLRYFEECARCKKLVCSWCYFVAETPEAKETAVCKDCQNSSEGEKTK